MRPLTQNQLSNLRCLAILEAANGRTLNRFAGNLTSLIRRGLVRFVVGTSNTPCATVSRFYGLTVEGRKVLAD